MISSASLNDKKLSGDEIQDNTLSRPAQPRNVTDSFPQINEDESPENDEPSTSQVKKSSSSNQFQQDDDQIKMQSKRQSHHSNTKSKQDLRLNQPTEENP